LPELVYIGGDAQWVDHTPHIIYTFYA